MKKDAKLIKEKGVKLDKEEIQLLRKVLGWVDQYTTILKMFEKEKTLIIQKILFDHSLNQKKPYDINLETGYINEVKEIKK